MTRGSPVGVGVIGAGLAVQSIHLPTLARLHDSFRIVTIWDIDEDMAQAVAAACGACASLDLGELLANPAVEVVAVCSPAALHADHVIAAMRAGKRAVLVEKPLASTREEAGRIAATALETGSSLVVGAMHVFDPAWQAVAATIPQVASEAGMIRSRIILPFNSRFEPYAFEPIPRAPQPPLPSAPDRHLAILRGGILQLAIHDLPLIRMLMREGATIEVTAAETFAPFGYAITLRAGDQLIELFAHVGDHWEPRWTLEAVGATIDFRMTFPPSFVSAGSASLRVSRNGVITDDPVRPGNGYDGEWQAIAALLRGGIVRIPDIDSVIADFAFALDITEQACALTGSENLR